MDSPPWPDPIRGYECHDRSKCAITAALPIGQWGSCHKEALVKVPDFRLLRPVVWQYFFGFEIVLMH